MFSFKTGSRKLKRLRTKKAAVPIPECNASSASSTSSDDSDSDYEEPNDTETLRENCLEQLQAEKLDVHLASRYCNSKSESMVKTIMMRLVKFLVWMYLSSEPVANSLIAAQIICEFITTKSKILPVYYQYLKEKVNNYSLIDN